MGCELFNRILDDGQIDISDNQIVSIISLLESDSFEDRDTAVNLRYTGLHGVVIEVHFSEFLILGVLLNILDKGGDRLEASLSDSWCANLSIQSLDCLDGVLDELSWSLLVLFLLFSSSSTESLTLVPLKLLPHARLLPSQLRFLSLLAIPLTRQRARAFRRARLRIDPAFPRTPRSCHGLEHCPTHTPRCICRSH